MRGRDQAESGLTCPACDDLSPYGTHYCVSCGARLLATVGDRVAAANSLRARFTEEARQFWAGDTPTLAPILEPEFALLVDNDNHSRKADA